MSLFFCEECNNMLYPREDVERKVLKYVCKKCGSNSDTSGETRVYINELKRTRQSILEDASRDWSEYVEDPTLPRTEIQCPKCKHNEAVVLSEFLSSGKMMSVWYICANPERKADSINAAEDRTCSFRWKAGTAPKFT